MRDRMGGRPPRDGSANNNSRRERPDMTEEDRELQRALDESKRMARGNRGNHRESDDGYVFSFSTFEKNDHSLR